MKAWIPLAALLGLALASLAPPALAQTASA